MSNPLPAVILVDTPPLTDADLDGYEAWLQLPADERELAEHVEPAAARWSVDGPRTCDWVVAKWCEADATLRELAERRDEYKQRIDDWYDRESKRSRRDADFFAGHAERYAVSLRAESGGKIKSVVTPAGRVSTRVTNPKVVVTDETELIGWAHAHRVTGVVQTVESVRLTELRGVVAPAEIPTRVVMSPCACVVEVEPAAGGPDGKLGEWWARGTGRDCPQCGHESLVGDWLATTLVAVNESGYPVPGVAVSPETVTATVEHT